MLPSFPTLLPFLLFAFVASITPGPTNILVLSNSARYGWMGAASLQLVNPKTWMMALAVVSVFAGGGEHRAVQVVYLSLVFFLVSLPCLAVWALLGAGSSRWLRSPRAMQRFNCCMDLLLLGSAWLSVLA